MARVFLEGEFYDVAAYWHISIPCVYDADTRKFLASVEISRGSKFRFFTISPNGQHEYLISRIYSHETQFDGSVVNVFNAESGDGCDDSEVFSDFDF